MRNQAILAFTLFMVFIFPSSGWAGALFGTIIDEQGRPLKNAEVKVTMDRNNHPYHANGTTDALGSYRIDIPEKGRGTLTVVDGTKTATIRVYVFQNSVLWNLKRVRTGSQLTLQRR